jgi:hypothetical protein
LRVSRDQKRAATLTEEYFCAVRASAIALITCLALPIRSPLSGSFDRFPQQQPFEDPSGQEANWIPTAPAACTGTIRKVSRPIFWGSALSWPA